MSTSSAYRLSLSILLLGLFGLSLSLPRRLAAQDVASITGVVTDETGAVVAGVSVTLRNPQTGDTYKAVTNTSGSYTINQIKPGPGYKISFVHEGFKDAVVSGLYLNVDATRVQNAVLEVGATHETVEVSAAGQTVTLDKTDATVGNNFEVQFMQDLPVEDRSNPSALFVQQPGVTLDGAVTGARTDQDRVTIDGLDVNDMATGYFGAIVANAPVDSVQEFRGVAAGFLSGAAGGGGGQYELVTRSGTNTFHGAVVEYHRDTDLEANDWFNDNASPRVPTPPLIRNQFGGNFGGPILKNKLFFFFDYNGRRDTLSSLTEREVPLDSFRAGNVAYVNTSGNLGTLDSAAVKGLDPAHIGFNSALLSLFSSRYPHANDFSGATGDLINTAGFRFNAPFPLKENDFVQRVDFNLNDKHKLWGRGSFTRTNYDYAAVQFPGDPDTFPHTDQSYAWVAGHVWTINNRMVNQASYGEVFESLNWPVTYNPGGVTQFYNNGFGGNGTGGTILSGPYPSAVNQQGRTYPIPVIRDDFSWDKGKHSYRFGGTFKYISPAGYTKLDYNQPNLGLGGFITGLVPSMRPGDINPNYTSLYDQAFALALAPYSYVTSTFNYNAQGATLPQGTGSQRDYRYYETELYFGDTWKATPALTVSYGVRWVNYTVPYEVSGLESIQNFEFNDYFGDRIAQSAAGKSGNTAVPLISYSVGGKANHAPGYFSPQYLNFGPRLAFAYSVNPKTVFNWGGGIIFDQTVINAVQYQQSQFDYLFESSSTEDFGTPSDPVASLATQNPATGGMPRFTGMNSPPAPPVAPAIVKPFYPFANSGNCPGYPNGIPCGLVNGLAFNEIIDPHLKTPYSIQYTAGLQHEFPSGYILRATYVGRLGRRLLAQVDANQLIDFPYINTAGQTVQMMSSAFGNVTQQLRAGVNPYAVTPQPWYEHLIPAGYDTFLYNYFGLAGYGFPPFTNNTQIVSVLENTLAHRGDFADTTQALAALEAIAPNVGMGSQFSENTFYTNQGFSNYDGLLTTLHKNLGYGLQFDLNYTWSHSIDNVSLVANSSAINGYGFICDELRPRECRNNSDFDVTHYFNGDFIYDLPFGKGKALAGSAPRWLDEIIGHWEVSGLPSWHSGNSYFAGANAFVAGYANNAPAILTGPISDLHIHINGGHGQPLQGFADPAQALADYEGPIGFHIGARNNLRTPSYFDMDMGLGKAFPLSTERIALKFRADAFNVFNHPNFSSPCTDITQVSCVWGTIGSTVGTGINNNADAARVLQVSLRLEF